MIPTEQERRPTHSYWLPAHTFDKKINNVCTPIEILHVELLGNP